MKKFFILIFCVALVVTGCHFSNTAHYRVANVAVGSRGADKIKSIVRMAARKAGMTNEFSSSIVPNTLISYGGGGDRPFVLGAYFSHGDVFIDLQGEYGSHMPLFESANRHMVPALTKEFGSSFQILGGNVTNDCGPGFSVDVLKK